MVLLLALALAPVLGCGRELPPVGAAPPAAPIEGAVRPPNVLLVTADDLGLQLRSYGDPTAATPNLDALAAEGVQFDVAYTTQSSCSPARSSLLTGLQAWATGQYGLVKTGLALHPELLDRTLPNLLAAWGYRTGIIGKLHVAPEESFHFDFSERMILDARDPYWVAETADRFLEQTGSQPFLLMVNYADPHVGRDDEGRVRFLDSFAGLPEHPVLPSARTVLPFQQIDAPQIRSRTSAYYSSIERLDAGIGMLMDALARSGHEDDTLVLFLGDHGPAFSRAKTTVYEAGLRIPFIVRWPGVATPGRRRALVSTIDVVPTVLDAVGAPAPGGLHGRSLRPVLRDPDAPWREYLVGEFNFHSRRAFFPRRAIRNQRFKLIHNLLAGRARPVAEVDGDPAYAISQTAAFDGTAAQRAFRTFADPPEFELYDLEEDPVEFHDLAARPAYRGTLQELKAALRTYRVQRADPLLDPARVEAMVAFAHEPSRARRPWWQRIFGS